MSVPFNFKDLWSLYESLPEDFLLVEPCSRSGLQYALDAQVLSGETLKYVTQMMDSCQTNNTDLHKVRYHRRGMGRFVPEPYGCALTVWRMVRGDLLNWDKSDNIINLDLKKAHPSLMVKLCEDLDLPKKDYTHLRTYIQNPELYFDSIALTADELNAISTAEGEPMSQKSACKLMINMMLYGAGSKAYTDMGLKRGKYPFRKDTIASLLEKEVSDIEMQVRDKSQYFDLFYKKSKALSAAKGKRWNKMTGMSNILLTAEAYCTYQAMEIFRGAYGSEALLTYENDGFSANLNPEYVPDLLQRLKTALPFLTFEVKEFEHLQDQDLVKFKETIADLISEKESNNALTKANDYPTYDELLKRFEENHAMIRLNKIWVRTTNGGVIFMSRDEVGHEIMEWMYKVQTPETVKFFMFFGIDSQYFRDPNKRAYEIVDNYPPPLTCPPNVYNLWVPYACDVSTPYTPNPEGVQKILDVLHVLCNHDTTVYEYMVDWTAQLIQFPGIKTTMPIFISKEGAGKGFWATVLESMLGSSKVLITTDPGRDVWGNFNELMVDAMVVILNEMDKRDLTDGKEKLKGIVTDKTITVNPKGKKPIKMHSYHRVIGFTNNEDPTPVGATNRRLAIIRSSDELIDKKVYWHEMFQLIEDPNVIRSLFDYFKARPNIDMFHTRGIPQTEHEQDLKDLSKSIYEQWLLVYAEGEYDKLEVKEKVIRRYTRDMFVDFQSWIDSCSMDWKGSTTKFSTNLKLLNLPGVAYFKKSRSTGAGYQLDLDILLPTNYLL